MNHIPHFLRWVLHIIKKGILGELNISDFSNPSFSPRPVENITTINEKLKRSYAETQKLQGKNSLLFAIWRTFKFPILFCLSIQVLDRCVLMAIERILLGQMVKEIRACSDSDCYSWVFLAFIIIAPLRVLLHRSFIYLNKLIYFNIKMGIFSLLYKKVLHLSPNSMRRIRTGDLVTLVSNGGIGLEHCEYILALVTGPLQIISNFYVLWIQFGASAGIGVTLIIILGIWQDLGELKTLTIFAGYLGKVSTEHRSNILSASAGRARLMTQILAGIKTIKVYAMEGIFSSLVADKRKKEAEEFKKSNFLELLRFVTAITSPLLAMTVTVFFHEVSGNEKTLEQVIVASTIFHSFRPLIFKDIRFGIKQLFNFKNAISKFQDILNADEVAPFAIYPGNGELIIEGLTLNSLPTDAPKCAKLIKHINLQVVKPELLVITGDTGAGKSSLFKAILGEFPIAEGKIRVGGRVSYAAQETWIFAGTIRDNILFHNKYQSRRYNTVLEVCALVEDLSSFQGGDETKLEEGGARLSEGQKARISLARAVYREAELYLLDDVLRNVDFKVGTHIFHRCINGFLKNKTRILITSNAISLNGTGKLFRLQNGTLVQISDETPIVDLNVPSNVEQETNLYTQKESGDDESGQWTKVKSIHRPVHRQSGVCWKYLATGSALRYFSQYIICTLVMMTLYQGTEHLLRKRTVAITEFNLTLVGLALFALSLAAFSQIFTLITIIAKSGQFLHDGILKSILHAPLQFYAQQSPGKILDSLTMGMSVVDGVLFFKLHFTSHVFLMYLSGYSIVVYKFGVTITYPVILLFTFGYFLQKWNIKICQQLSAISSVAKRPITSRLISAVTGVTTIRALEKIKEMEAEYDKCLDLHFWTHCAKLSVSSFATLLIELATVGTLNILVIFAMFFPQFGIETAFSPLLAFGAAVGFGFSAGIVLVTHEKQIERILDLHKIPTENEEGGNEDAPTGWPWKGKIVFSDVSVAYEPSHPVLRNISFIIKPGEKIAIIGRTGCGKSTLISALSRLVEASGDILIDGLNISKISLKSLRRNIAIIPQDPYFFDGTLRFCLDPFQEFGDAELFQALRTVHLVSLVENLPNGLQTEIGECGNIFSSGQRQLLSLARAILRKPNVLIMDESTASVDGSTSHAILSEIVKSLSHSTVITVLHRLTFIDSYDRVMVINQGEIAEFGPPRSLSRKYLPVVFPSPAKFMYDSLIL